MQKSFVLVMSRVAKALPLMKAFHSPGMGCGRWTYLEADQCFCFGKAFINIFLQSFVFVEAYKFL